MIEVAAGLALIAVAALLSGGLGLFPDLVWADQIAIAASFLGALLVAHGLFRYMRDRSDGSHYWLRTGALMVTMITITSAVSVAAPVYLGPFTLVQIGGFPAGYYMVAQGCLIVLAVLLFVFARRQQAIDAEANSSLPQDNA